MIGRDLDFDLHKPSDLIAEGMLEENSEAHGVARRVIQDGYGLLSITLQGLYDAAVTPALRKRAKEIEGKRLRMATS
jgi:hypothetical protein